MLAEESIGHVHGSFLVCVILSTRCCEGPQPRVCNTAANRQPASVKPDSLPFGGSSDDGVAVRFRRASSRRRLGPSRCWPLTAVLIFSASIQIEYAAEASNDAFGVRHYKLKEETSGWPNECENNDNAKKRYL